MKKIAAFIILFWVVCAVSAQVTRAWVAGYNGQGDYNDRFTCLAKDGLGNLYLGGSTVNPGVDRDFLITKMTENGTVLWSRTFNGPGDGPDEVRAIASDAAGNCYITGISKGDNTSEDYLVLKLKPNGDTVWTYRYDFVGEYDQPNSIAVDNQGAVYVTGQSDHNPGLPLNDDYCTIKLSPAGLPLWVQRFDGFGTATDRAVKVLADNLGNAYVTGRSDNGTNDDYVTMQFNSDGGITWIRYDDRGERDRAEDMVQDASGNLYVTGRSDNGTNDDYWTLKITPDGDLVWDKTYDYLDQDRPLAMTLDAAGHLFITGQSDNDVAPTTDWDYLTLAYNTNNGNLLWEKRYDGTGTSDDFANSLAVDGAGHLYVTGLSNDNPNDPGSNAFVTLGYDVSNGATLFTKIFVISPDEDNVGYAVTGLANGCIVAGYGEAAGNQNRNGVIIRYQSDGAQPWMHTFDGIGDNNDNIRALAITPDHQLYAAGYIAEAGNNRNLALVSFGTEGQVACAYTLEGTSTGSIDDALAVQLDGAGNAIVGGVTKNSGSSNDITLLSLNNLCDTNWTRLVNGPGQGSDRLYDMVKSVGNNYYFTGRVDVLAGPLANDNAILGRFNADGTIAWTKTYDSGPANSDRGTLLVATPEGGVAMAGRSFDGQKHTMFIRKHYAPGTLGWSAEYGGVNLDVIPRDMAVDGNNNLIVAAEVRQLPDTNFNILLEKFDENGALVFQSVFGETGNDEPVAVGVDTAGNIILTTLSDVNPGASPNIDIKVFKFQPDGTPEWQTTLHSAAEGADQPDDLAIDKAGRVYLTGHFNNGTETAPNFDIATFILDTDGAVLWSDIFNGESDSSDIPNLIYLDGNDFYVAGSSVRTGQQRNMIVIKYSMVSGTDEVPLSENAAVFPNPFVTTLTISVPGNNESRLELFDQFGRRVIYQAFIGETLHLTTPDLLPGVYSYRISSGNTIVKTGLVTRVP